VRVKLGNGTQVHGRIIHNSTGEPPSNATDLAVLVFPTSFDDVPTTASAPKAIPDKSGAFVLQHLWGSGVVRLLSPDGVYLKRVLVEGVDITDAPLRFDSASASREMIVEVGSDHTELSGFVRTANGEPFARCTVVAFEVDKNRVEFWSRFVATTSCAEDGSFQYFKLPEGHYFVLAVPASSDVQPDDPAWREAHRAQATTVWLVAGVRQSVTLRLKDEEGSPR
jgi:hypothetical protein